MDSKIKTLKERGDKLFDRYQLMSLFQEEAEQFYPERADFTTIRNLGEDLASHLTTSYPILCRRDLGNQFSTMLRPRDIDWFEMKTVFDTKDLEAKRWLEEMSKRQRRAMYDRLSQFVRATREGDHDFATFGQCVLTAEFNRFSNTLLYRCWHLRDVAWREGEDGQICEIHRNWKPAACELSRLFKGKVSQTVKDLLVDDPHQEIAVRHVVLKPEAYDNQEKKFRTPWVSIYFEVDGGHILEEIGSFNKIYTIPRWQTVSGSQYAYSPATVAALPDARLIQQMTLVLLEAGEKAVNPPLIATQEVVRSDIGVYAGGITWVDAEYDERMGDALRPMNIDSRGIPLGMEMREDIKEMISQAFFLNKINMPPSDGKPMTAYETAQRVQQYVRDAAPLFEPMEMDYNGQICDDSFDLLLRAGVFGAPSDMPKSLRGQNIEFRFESPLHDAMERKKGQSFNEAKELLAQAAEIDPGAAQIVDVRIALRDALNGIGIPSTWVRDEKQMEAIDKQNAAKQQQNETMATLQQGGMVAEQMGKAGQAMKEMQA